MYRQNEHVVGVYDSLDQALPGRLLLDSLLIKLSMGITSRDQFYDAHNANLETSICDQLQFNGLAGPAKVGDIRNI